LHQFLYNLVFFTKSLLLTSTFIELLLQASLQPLATKDKYTFDKKEVFMTSCPCCTNQMLRHLRQGQVYWFCRQCWQEMPVYCLNSYGSLPSINLVTGLSIKKQLSSEAVVLIKVKFHRTGVRLVPQWRRINKMDFALTD
jgi:hypothetical protein